MRVIKFKGKTAYLKEEYYKKLLRRFTPTKKELRRGSIEKSCVLCLEFSTPSFSGQCGECPLSVWRRVEGVPGCIVLLRSIVPFKKSKISMGEDSIEFEPDDIPVVKRQLSKIRKALLRLPRIEKRKRRN